MVGEVQFMVLAVREVRDHGACTLGGTLGSLREAHGASTIAGTMGNLHEEARQRRQRKEGDCHDLKWQIFDPRGAKPSWLFSTLEGQWLRPEKAELIRNGFFGVVARVHP